MKTLSDLIKEQLPSVTQREILNAVAPTTQKLTRIISREGDADGARLTAPYIAMLMAEEIQMQRVSELTKTLCKQTSNEGKPHTVNYSIAITINQ